VLVGLERGQALAALGPANEIQQFWGQSAEVIELGHHRDVIALQIVRASVGSIRFWSRVLTQYARGISHTRPEQGMIESNSKPATCVVCGRGDMRRLNPILGLLAVSFMGTAHAQQSGEVAASFIPRTRWPNAPRAPAVVRAIFGEVNRLGYIEGENLLIARYSGPPRFRLGPRPQRALGLKMPLELLAVATR
jgi:hypothetical protein